MTGGKEVFQSIADGAVDVGDCADELNGHLTDMQETLTSESPWGEDEAGTVFGMVYTATLSHALESIGTHVTLLAEGAQRMVTWAEQSMANEDANERDADAIDPDVVEV